MTVSAPAHPAIDLVDETFLAVPPAVVAAAFADETVWTTYWPDLVLQVYRDRGDEGLRWTVTGALVGTMEVWCEQVMDGTVLHYYLRATPESAMNPRAVQAEYARRAKAAKSIALGLKDTLEDGREPGVPPRS